MRAFYTGIDIGTYHVKIVIVAAPEGMNLPMRIIGTGSATSKGMRHGFIVDKKEVARCIEEALMRAAGAAKVKVKSARLAMGGIGLDEIRSQGEVTLTSSGGIVTDRELERVERECEKKISPKLTNRTIVHKIPLEYRVDGEKVYGRPQGLQGTKLGVDTLFITMLTQHHDDMIEAVEAVGVEVEGVMAAPLAASLVTLTKAQKTAGVALANIGAETLSLIVFDEDIPISIKMFPIGSTDITNSIALSFRIAPTEAEQMKRGAVTGSDIAPKRIYSIITPKLKEMFALINAHLKAIGRQRLLPAGIILTGGGSSIASAADIARGVLKLPSQIGMMGNLTRTGSVDVSWAVAYGLCRWAYGEEANNEGYSLGTIIRRAGETIKQALRSMLP